MIELRRVFWETFGDPAISTDVETSDPYPDCGIIQVRRLTSDCVASCYTGVHSTTCKTCRQ